MGKGAFSYCFEKNTHSKFGKYLGGMGKGPYHMVGNFGDVFDLVNWCFFCGKLPNLKSTNIIPYTSVAVWKHSQSPNL